MASDNCDGLHDNHNKKYLRAEDWKRLEEHYKHRYVNSSDVFVTVALGH